MDELDPKDALNDEPSGSDAPEPAPPPAGPPRGIGPAWLRAVLVLPISFALQLGVFIAGGLALALLPLELPEGIEGGVLLLTAATYLLVVPGIWLAWWLLDRASLADMGHAGPLLRGLRELFLGFLGGVVLLSAVVLLGAALGAWTLEPGHWKLALGVQGLWIPALLLAAYFEELVLRGWILQDFGRRSALLGLVVSSVLFAVVHGANPNVLSEGPLGAALAFLNIFLAGLLLGALFLLTGRIWVPTGLHLGWNWTVAVLFGLPVSGFDLPSFLEGRNVEGTGTLSGGAFGPEASLPALGVLAPVALGLTWLALKRRCRVPVVARHDPPPPDGDIIQPSPERTEPLV